MEKVIFWKKLHKDAVLPKRATKYSLCFDFFSYDTYFIHPGGKQMIPLGIAWEPGEEDVHMLIFPRSGISKHHPNYVANNVGVIDNDYRGEFLVPVVNHGSETMIIRPNKALVQGLIIQDSNSWVFLKVDTLVPSDRNEGGFGSTDEPAEEAPVLEQVDPERYLGG